MKTNTLSKLMATMFLGLGMVFASATAASAAYQTHVLVGDFSTTAAPGTTVRIPVRLGYQDRAKGNQWVYVAGKPLVVEGYLSGGTKHDLPFAIADVTTDGNGNATVSFVMPHKLRNNAGNEVGTALRVTVRFAGTPPNLLPGGENRTISVTVR